jgi:hypothetical protein
MYKARLTTPLALHRVFSGGKRPRRRISYARHRRGYAPAELDVLSDNWNVGETISSETVRDLI